jgi:exosortase
MVVLCWRPIVDLFRLSLSSDVYSHLFVIPLISGSLIYLRRRLVFGRTGGTRGAAISFFLLAIALVLLSRGLSSSISHEFALQLAILGFVMLIWSGFAWIFGSLAFSEAVFPLFLLVFMVPPPGFILDRFIAWLQVGSANVTNWLFYVTGAHAVRDGLYFSLPGVLIVISKECSGIRSTIALLITCMAAGYLLLRTPWARAVLLLAALPVLVIKNGIRIASLTLLAIHVDPSFLYGSLHREGGIVFFAIGLLILFPVLLGLQHIERDRALREQVSSVARASV